jgi:hypothetical protein
MRRSNRRTSFIGLIVVVVSLMPSGVKTFMVSREGRVFEEDLGPGRTQLAAAMKSYDPDGTWTLVRRNQFLNDQITP